MSGLAVEGAGLGLLEQPGSARFSPDPPSPPKDDLVATPSVYPSCSFRPIGTPLGSDRSVALHLLWPMSQFRQRSRSAGSLACPSQFAVPAAQGFTSGTVGRDGEWTPRRSPPLGGASSLPDRGSARVLLSATAGLV